MLSMQKFKIPNPNEQEIPSLSNLFKIILLIILLFASFYLAQRGALALEAPHRPHLLAATLEWGLIVALAIWDGVLLIGMGALAHDAVHKVLFRSGFWNEFWGGLLSALVLAPFYANRQIHLTHHAYSHQPGLDPENDMHNRPFLHAMTLGSLVGLYIHYRLIAYNLLHMADRKLAMRAFKDIFFVASAGGVYFVLAPRMGFALSHTVVPMLLLFPLVFAWRGLSDHYGIPPIVRESKKREQVLEPEDGRLARDRQLEVSGWVVLTYPWLEWLWSGVNYHEVHHKYPFLSHRYLKEIFEATREIRPYLVVHGYWRSLFNARRRKYYATQEEVCPFLSSTIPG
jgi:fatty acid desaturase